MGRLLGVIDYMGEYFKKIVGQISDFISTLSPIKKVAMVGLGVGIVATITGLFFWAGETTYVPLMTNLNAEDSASIIRVLHDKHIPFKVDPTGKMVSIPPESLYDLRLELASQGMPQSSVVGYEVFDKQSLGTTSFVQKVNQKRALEGEITRTITTIKGVRHARVHLAMPQKSTFVEDQKKSTASVALDLDPGTVLNDKQVYGIGNLVARAIEGMEVNDVVIVDSNGKVLSKNSNDPLSAATANNLDFEQKVESDYEHRIENILNRIVGEGHVVAKVTADLDFSQVAETQTIVDGDSSAIISMEKRSENMNGTRPGPMGLSGAVSNRPDQPPAANGGEVHTETGKNNEVTNYEVPKTIRRTTKPTGTVKRLSVAVLIDGKQVRTTGKDGVVQSKVEDWPVERIKEFEGLVASAVGIDKKRGDILEIRNMEFSHEDFEEANRVIAEKDRKSYIQNMVTYGVIGLAILLFFFFVVRPFVKWLTENTIDSVDTFLPQTIEELERMQKNAILPGLEDSIPLVAEKMDPEKIEGEMIKEKIVTLVDANPHKAALILKDWLHSGGKVKEDGGKPKSASA